MEPGDFGEDEVNDLFFTGGIRLAVGIAVEGGNAEGGVIEIATAEDGGAESGGGPEPAEFAFERMALGVDFGFVHGGVMTAGESGGVKMTGRFGGIRVLGGASEGDEAFGGEAAVEDSSELPMVVCARVLGESPDPRVAAGEACDSLDESAFFLGMAAWGGGGFSEEADDITKIWLFHGKCKRLIAGKHSELSEQDRVKV